MELDLKRIEDMEAKRETNRKHLEFQWNSNGASRWKPPAQLLESLPCSPPSTSHRGNRSASRIWRGKSLPQAFAIAGTAQVPIVLPAPIICRWITWTTCWWSPTCRAKDGQRVEKNGGGWCQDQSKLGLEHQHPSRKQNGHASTIPHKSW